MSTVSVSPLRQRMIEDMNARKLGAGTQRGHIASCKRCAADVPRGTMDEVSSLGRLGPAVRLLARPPERLFRLVLESHDGRALVPIPERSASP
jgi:hypothetical protein